MKSLMVSIVMMVGVSALAESINNVTARQRWPWNGIVDVDFALDGKSGERYQVEVEASSATSGKRYFAKTYLSDPVVASGAGRVTWDFGADYPGVRENDVQFTVSAVPLADSDKAVYLVIDLSGGANAAKWPVRYTSEGPGHVQGATGEKCQTMELWLKRIHANGADFNMRSRAVPTGDNEFFYSRLTKDFYIGLFEVTQQQWYQMTGNWISYFSREDCRASRPIDCFTSNLFYGNTVSYHDNDRTPVANSLLEKIIAKTGLASLNLPTEAQWVYACMGGTTMLYDRYAHAKPNGEWYWTYTDCARYSANSGEGWSTAEAAATCDLSVGTAAVGSLGPNFFGLYDMFGNVTEDLLDPWLGNAALKKYYADGEFEFPIVDPKGPTGPNVRTLQGFSSASMRMSVLGGAFNLPVDYIDWRGRAQQWNSYVSDGTVKNRGCRFCVTVE